MLIISTRSSHSAVLDGMDYEVCMNVTTTHCRNHTYSCTIVLQCAVLAAWCYTVAKVNLIEIGKSSSVIQLIKH